MRRLAGDAHFRGNLGQGIILLAVQGEDAALILRQQAPVEGRQEGQIHLPVQIFPRQGDPLLLSGENP